MLRSLGEASEGLGVLGCGMVDQFGKIFVVVVALGCYIRFSTSKSM